MELWSAFFLGLVGSLHCAGMCGPLALAVPVRGGTRAALAASRVIYNAGRIGTYSALGLCAGAAGKTLALAGLQRWLALGSGVILLGFAVASILRLKLGNFRAFAVFQRLMPALLRKPSHASIFALGMLNGLLPCGLAYAACAAAASTGAFLSAALYMLAFGVGTLPMMLAIPLAGSSLGAVFRVRIPHLVPAASGLLAVLLIVRGLSLGIALSPDLSEGHPKCSACGHLEIAAKASRK